MKKTFAFLWCALAGCTIVPDDSFETVPKASLKKITITSNESNYYSEPALAVETLVAEASHSGNTTTLAFTGNLDPFWFKEKVEKIDYTFNSNRLVEEILLYFEGGGQQLEEFTYDERGNLSDAKIRFGVDGVNYLYDYDFYYYVDNERGHLLDSVAKTVSRTGASSGVARGFYKRDRNMSQLHSPDFYYSIFPYQNGDELRPPQFSCDSFWESGFDDHSSYEVGYQPPFNYFRHANWVYKGDMWTVEDNSTYYEAMRIPMIDAQKSLSTRYAPSLTNANGTTYMANNACSEFLHGISIYRLIPEMNYNYVVLHMLNMAEERAAVTEEPNRLSRYKDIDVYFEYNYAE